MWEEAIERANNTPYGLSAGVWTDKGSKIFKIVSKLRAGVVWANTYNRFDGYDVKAAEDYWAASKDYWAAVRGIWAKVAETKNGVAIQEEAQTGTVISGRLLEIADEIQAGKLRTDKAVAEARKLIEGNTRPLPAG